MRRLKMSDWRITLVELTVPSNGKCPDCGEPIVAWFRTAYQAAVVEKDGHITFDYLDHADITKDRMSDLVELSCTECDWELLAPPAD